VTTAQLPKMWLYAGAAMVATAFSIVSAFKGGDR